eukprot:3601561-Rhodomonas_salina.2
MYPQPGRPTEPGLERDLAGHLAFYNDPGYPGSAVVAVYEFARSLATFSAASGTRSPGRLTVTVLVLRVLVLVVMVPGIQQ